jgi:hypothetical protein
MNNRCRFCLRCFCVLDTDTWMFFVMRPCPHRTAFQPLQSLAHGGQRNASQGRSILARRFWRAKNHPPQPGNPRRNPWYIYPAALLVLCGTSIVAYQTYKPFRHSFLAVVRCSRVAEAAILGAIDYKRALAKSYSSDEEEREAFSRCHTRSAHRVLKALLANGGTLLVFGYTYSSS